MHSLAKENSLVRSLQSLTGWQTGWKAYSNQSHNTQWKCSRKWKWPATQSLLKIMDSLSQIAATASASQWPHNLRHSHCSPSRWWALRVLQGSFLFFYLSYYDKLHHCSVPQSGQWLRLQNDFWGTQPRWVTNPTSWSLKLYICCFKLMASCFFKSCRYRLWREKSLYYVSTWIKTIAKLSWYRWASKSWCCISLKPWKTLGSQKWSQCSNCRMGCSRMIWKGRVWHRNRWALKLKPSLRGCAYQPFWCLHSLNERWKVRWTRQKYTVRVRARAFYLRKESIFLSHNFRKLWSVYFQPLRGYDDSSLDSREQYETIFR